MDGGGSTTTSTSEPWEAQKGFLERGFDEALGNVLERPLSYFPDSTVVPFSPETTMAMGAQETRALQGSPLLGGAQDYTGDVLGGGYLSSNIPGSAGEQAQQTIGGGYLSPNIPGSAGQQAQQTIGGGNLSPYIPGSAGEQTQGTVEGEYLSPSIPGLAGSYTQDVLGGQFTSPETNPFFANIGDSVLSLVQPQVASSFASAGRTGGSPAANEALGRGVSRGMAPFLFDEYGRERNIQEQAAGRSYDQYAGERVLQENAAGRAYDRFGQERGFQEGATDRAFDRYAGERGFMQDAANLAPELAREDYFDIAQLANVGAMREGKAGEQLSDQMARWNFGQNEPANRIGQFMSLVQGNYGGTETTTGSQSSDPLSTILGAGLGAAGAAGPFFKPTVICTALYKAGLLDAATLKRADAWGAEHPVVADGYRLWATPVAHKMDADPIFCRRVHRLAMPLIRKLVQGGPDWSPAGIMLGLGVAGCWLLGHIPMSVKIIAFAIMAKKRS